MEEQKVYYHNLGAEWPVCEKFYYLGERYDHDPCNVPDEDYPTIIEQLKGFVKDAPRYLEPYLWLEVIYDRSRKRRSSEAIFKKATAKAFQMVMGREKRWPDEMSWGDMNNRVLIRIFIRKADELWHMGRGNSACLQEAYTIYLNLLKSNRYDNPCSRLYVLAILEGMSSDEFHERFMDYDEYGDYCYTDEVFDWFKANGRKYEAMKWWFEYADKSGLL